jgi:trigger factor
MKIEKNDLPKGEVEFKIVIDTKDFETYHNKGFENVRQTVEIDGFRKGNATEDAIVKKYGDMIILEEMANLALRDAYIKAVDEHKITPVSQPNVTITKLAKGNPLELTITVAVMPEVKLPAYKKIAKEIVAKHDEKIEVTDKDIEDVLEELRKGRGTQHDHDHHDHSHDGHDHEGHDHAHDHNHDHKHEDAVLPELNDEFAQSFGDNFKTLVDLKKKVGENMKLEKEQKLREKRRSAVMEKLVSETNIDMPEVIVEGELEQMLSQMKADITRFGGTWEDYLKHSKKTEAELKNDWRKDALKRAMSQLILHKIAEAEKLQATDEEIEVELVRVLASVQDADENRAKSYLYQALTNEKVLKFLEESK